MKKLITARMVRQAHTDGIKEIEAFKNQYIVTPEARSLAKDLGIALLEEQKQPDAAQNAQFNDIDETTVRQVIERVVERLPADQRDPNLIREVVIDVLQRFKK